MSATNDTAAQPDEYNLLPWEQGLPRVEHAQLPDRTKRGTAQRTPLCILVNDTHASFDRRLIVHENPRGVRCAACRVVIDRAIAEREGREP